jgi:UDP-glucose 4-epimerase
MTMHILITGIAAFLGAPLARSLVKAGHSVTGVRRGDHPRVDRLKEDCPALDIVVADLGGEGAFDAFPRDIDAVVHVAATSPMPGVSVAQLFYDNVTATRNLIEYAKRCGARCFVYTSSLSVHGNVGESKIDEATPIGDPDLYGTTKRLAEMLFADVADGIDTVALRLPGVLGPGAHRHWLARMLDDARAGREISIFNPDAVFNNAAYTSNLASFVVRLVEGGWKGFHVMPVAADGATTIRGAAETVIRLVGSSSRIVVGPSERSSFTVSSRRAVEGFGYRPLHIEAMLDQYVKENA